MNSDIWEWLSKGSSSYIREGPLVKRRRVAQWDHDQGIREGPSDGTSSNIREGPPDGMNSDIGK